MKTIDKTKWDRFEMFEFFKSYDLPRYQITVDIDVTNLYNFAKANDLSFYFSMMWVVMKEINQIENFKYRIQDDQVVYYDEIHPSFTDLIKNSDRFKIVNTTFVDDIYQFVKEARNKSEKQNNQFINYNEEIRQDLVYITVFPWFTYSHITNATKIDSKDAIPRIIWGKYKKLNDKLIMPFTLEVHHGFVDGYHIGLFLNKMVDLIEQL
ncbi:MAG: hypothetical protein K8Q99_05770 [Acholeplasmataceae bacterium]|nr:hypothetical protein [Acholeplasmataceae bacterium]